MFPVTDPAAVQAAGENMLQVSIPIKTQDFFLEKLHAVGVLDSNSAMGQSSGDTLDD